jgi:hypothetical protein
VKLSSRQEMKVQMENRLSRSGIIVIDDPEAFSFHAILPCYTGGYLENVTDQRRILIPNIERIHGMLPGDNQHMQRSYRSDILYDNKVFILVYLPGRHFTSDNLTENAFFHTVMSSYFPFNPK